MYSAVFKQTAAFEQGRKGDLRVSLLSLTSLDPEVGQGQAQGQGRITSPAFRTALILSLL